MTLDQIHLIAEIIQLLTVSVGIVFGGLWAMFRLAASRELRQKQISLQIAEQQLNAKKGFSFSIDVTECRHSMTSRLIISVLVQNKSTEVYTLDFRVPPLIVSELIPSSDGNHEVHICAKLPVLSVPIGSNAKRLIRTGTQFLPESERTYYFYWEPEHAGIYLVTYAIPIPRAMSKHMDHEQTDDLFEKIKKEGTGSGNLLRVDKIIEVSMGLEGESRP